MGAGREPWLGREGSVPHLFLVYSSFIPHFCPFCQVSLALLALIFPSETGQEEKLSCLAAGEPLLLAGWGAQHLLQANQREVFQHHQLLPPSSSSSLLVDPLLRNILQLESGFQQKNSPLSCSICYSELVVVFFLSIEGKKNRKKRTNPA